MTRYAKNKHKAKPRKTVARSMAGFTAQVSGAVATGKTVASYAKKAWAGVQMLKRLVNVEINMLDNNNSLSTTDLSTTGKISCLSLCATGDGIGARTGLSIRPQHLEVRSLYIAGSVPAIVRQIIFKKMEDSGTLPLITEILESASPLSPYSNENIKEFSILSDKCYEINAAQRPQAFVQFDQAISSHITYDSTSSAQTSAKQGHCYLMVLTEIAAGATCPTGFWNTRLSFTDN